MVPTPLNIDRHEVSHDSVRGWSWSHKTSMHSIKKVPGGKNKQLLQIGSVTTKCDRYKSFIKLGS